MKKVTIFYIAVMECRSREFYQFLTAPSSPMPFYGEYKAFTQAFSSKRIVCTSREIKGRNLVIIALYTLPCSTCPGESVYIYPGVEKPIVRAHPAHGAELTSRMLEALTKA